MSQDLYRYELEKNHKHNSLMNILDATFFQVGFAGFVPAIIIVAYLKHFTDNEMILNLPVFIANFSFSLGPFIMSFYSGRVKNKKRAAVLFGFAQRVMLLPILLVVVFLSGSGTLIVPAFLAAFTLFYFVWGAGSIYWQEMIGHALAPDKFTSAMGIRESVSRIVGFFASLGVTAILAGFAFPKNFAALLAMGFVFWFISFFFITRIKEAAYNATNIVRPSKHLKNILMLPVRDRSFRWYMIFILLYYGFLFVGGLYTVTGIERFGGETGSDQLTGIIGIMTVLSSSLFSFIVGRICEKVGKLWGFVFFTVINMLLPLSMAFCGNYYLYLFLIFLSGIINASWFLEISMLMGFSVPEKRNEYIAFNSLVKLIPIILYTNLGGYFANTFSSHITFYVSSAFGLAALLVLAAKFRCIFANGNIDQ
jgi:hypothetical protein